MKVFVLLTIAVMLMVSAGVASVGFGCPWNRMKCPNHCKSISGRAGGFCGGMVRLTCACYRNKKK